MWIAHIWATWVEDAPSVFEGRQGDLLGENTGRKIHDFQIGEQGVILDVLFSLPGKLVTPETLCSGLFHVAGDDFGERDRIGAAVIVGNRNGDFVDPGLGKRQCGNVLGGEWEGAIRTLRRIHGGSVIEVAPPSCRARTSWLRPVG